MMYTRQILYIFIFLDEVDDDEGHVYMYISFFSSSEYIFCVFGFDGFGSCDVMKIYLRLSCLFRLFVYYYDLSIHLSTYRSIHLPSKQPNHPIYPIQHTNDTQKNYPQYQPSSTQLAIVL